MPDYQNSQIYKSVSNKTPDIYIGSCLMRLSTRLSQHKKKCNDCSSKKLFVDDAIVTIVLIENYPCKTKTELKARELHHITTNICININKPFVCDIPYADTKAWKKEYQLVNAEQHKASQKIYLESHKEQLKEHKKIYDDTHREQISAQKKKYYHANKEQISTRQRARYAEKKLSQNLEHTLNDNSITV